jgi:hypothetical protein
MYSSFFYKFYNDNNIIKLSFLFFYLYSLNNKKLIIYNLNVFND